MEWARRWLRRASVALARDAFERRMDDEMRHHVECETAERVRQGMSPEAARAAALGAFGRVERYKEEARAARGLRLLESALVDARFALRVLGRDALFTAATVVTFALGVGAATAIFSVVYGVLLRPLPYREPDRLAAVWERDVAREGTPNVVSVANFEAWRARSRSFASMAALVPRPTTLAGDGAAPERVVGAEVSGEYFELLGAAPALGSAFTPRDVAAGRGDRVVLSDALWKRRFGGDRAVVGRTVPLDGAPYTVVGVMPPGFEPPRFGWLGEQAFWVPFVPTAQSRSWGRFLLVIGRLRPHVAMAQASAEMASVAAGLAREVPADRGWSAMVVPLATQVAGDARPALLALLGTVGLLAVMAVTNVAMLTLSRVRRHRGELAVRRAMGASRGRLVRQLLTQSTLLGATGAAVAVGVAVAGVRLLTLALPPDTPRASSIRVDAPVLLFALATAFVATLAFGVVGAVRGTAGGAAGSVAPVMRERWTTRRSRGAGSLVAAEVALGLVLSVLAALMVRSFVALRRVDLGFRAEQVVVARVALPGDRYASAESQRAFFAALLARVRALPGVRAAGLASTRPLGGLGPATTVADAERPAPTDAEAPVADVRYVDREFFRALRIPLLAGAPFDARERPNGAPRVVVSEALARTLWPGQRAVGRRARIAMFGGIDAEVAGVVGDVRLMEPRAAPRPTAYLAADRFPDGTRDLVVRGDGSPATLEASVRAALATLDPTLPMYDVRTLDGLVGDALARDRFTTMLLGAFATLALVLAAVGIFGVLSTDVADRRAELGIRLALGARRSAVLAQVVRQAVARAAIGVALGAAAALVAARQMAALLFGVGAADPVSFAGVAALLLAVAAVAALVPAARAARISPVTAMRAGQ